MSNITVTEQGFIDYLEKLVNQNDRGAIANLRRGLGKPPGAVPQMDRYILKFLSEDTLEQEEPYYLVASLFALWHQGRDKAETAEGNLGRSLRELVEREKDPHKKDNLEKSIERRLVALLNSHRDDLPHHLRQILGLLRAKDVPVNWGRLLSDVKHWESDNRWVQKQWARGFWMLPHPDSQEGTIAAGKTMSQTDTY